MKAKERIALVKKLQKWIDENNETAAGVAACFDLSRKTVKEWLTGTNLPSTKSAEKIKQLVGSKKATPPPAGKNTWQSYRQRIVEFVNGSPGSTVNEIAAAIGKHRNNVGAVCQQLTVGGELVREQHNQVETGSGGGIYYRYYPKGFKLSKAPKKQQTASKYRDPDMTIADRALLYIEDNPGAGAGAIQTAIDCHKNSLSPQLWRLVNKGKIKRDRKSDSRHAQYYPVETIEQHPPQTTHGKQWDQAQEDKHTSTTIEDLEKQIRAEQSRLAQLEEKRSDLLLQNKLGDLREQLKELQLQSDYIEKEIAQISTPASKGNGIKNRIYE